jgi:hypothetical protein
VKRRPQEWLYRVAIYQSARGVCLPRCNCWLAETCAWLATGSNSRRKQQWSIAITVQPANNGKRTCKLPRRCSPTNQSNYQSESLCANEGLELIDRSFISTCLCSPSRELFIIPMGICHTHTHTHTHTHNSSGFNNRSFERSRDGDPAQPHKGQASRTGHLPTRS